MKTITLQRSAVCLALLSVATAANAFSGLTDQDSLEIKSRTVFFDREYDDSPNKDSNTLAQGLELNYQSGKIADWFKIGWSAYGVQNINTTGTNNSAGILPDGDNSNGVDNQFGKIGQAYIELLPSQGASLKIGYQKTKNMFVASSGSRAIPSTFRGISGSYQIVDSVKVYGYAFDQWSARDSDQWDDFNANTNGPKIDLIYGIGAQFKQGKFAADSEYMVSADYLEKFGIRGSYTEAVGAGKIKLSAGYFSSSDNGALFAENGDKNDDGITSNDGSVWFIDADYRIHAFSFGVAFSQTDEIWLEDNFKGDHGTNPLPTRAPIGPDMTNANESVWLVRTGVDFGKLTPALQGLSTQISYAKGSDIENAKDASLGQAEEQFLAIDTRYTMPMVKGLSVRYLFANYNGTEIGSVEGVKEDNTDHRLYLDYRYQF
ncbi:OprD family outer membrane porin [Ferrimonas senticii]|uniref:OprD family outer membrane porin n=1 Tax=Ferrimonas senticii TaxID=394566 RepID=UPI000404F8E2|nr:OprD family outer membrane porin [Ferrimonas senticii]